MQRNTSDKMLGGVLSGMARAMGLPPALLRVIFVVAFLGIGGITLGVSSGAMTIIYLLFWMFVPADAD
jgi:phage shock protein PspC (stress-responsive transcriptional regulator)